MGPHWEKITSSSLYCYLHNIKNTLKSYRMCKKSYKGCVQRDTRSRSIINNTDIWVNEQGFYSWYKIN